MSLKFSFVLMVLFLGLGYLAFFEPLRTGPKEDEQRERESHVVWLRDAKLAEIHVRGEKPPVDLVCVNKEKACPFDGSGEWAVGAPAPGNADASAVGTLAGTLLNLTHNGKIDFEQGFDEKEFGLDKPRAEITLKLVARKDPIVLKIGKASPVGPDVYLSVSGDPKHLYQVPNYLPGMVDQEPFHWRNKRLFPAAEATAVSRIEWKAKAGSAFRAVRDGDAWRLERPVKAEASRIMIEGLGSTLSYAQAKAVFAESREAPEARKALAGRPELEASFALNGGAEHVLRVFPRSPREKLALVDDLAPVYAVDAAAFDRFGKELREYRRRSVLSDADRSAADELRLSFPRDKQELTLTLKNGLWERKEGDAPKGMLSQARINGFLDQLRDADYKAFFPSGGASAEAKAWRGATPDARVEVKVGGQAVAAAALLVRERKQALTEAEGEVRTLGGEAFLKFLPVRLSDLTESANRAVVTEKGGANGHDSGASEHAD